MKPTVTNSFDDTITDYNIPTLCYNKSYTSATNMESKNEYQIGPTWNHLAL